MYNFNLRKSMRLCLAAMALAVFSTGTAFGQLSGSYTIDGSQSASSSNYQTFASAVSDLVSGSRADGGKANGSGVSGAVTFKIASGSYTEQITIASIKGVSAKQTVTFQSAAGDSSKVILKNASSSSSSTNYTLQLDGADHIIFKQISIIRTGTNAYAKVVDINNDADSNEFVGNLIKGQLKMSENVTGLGIVVDEATIFSNTASNDYNLFKGNRIKYGYNGISFGSSCTNNQIINNIIDTCGMSGAYMLNQTNLSINGNTFNMGTITVTGKTHYLSYGVRLEYTANLNMLANKFYSTSGAQVSRCLTLFYGTLTTATNSIGNIVANNFAWVSAGSSSSTGITLGGNSDLTVVYNNVLMTSTPTASAALYIYPQYSASNVSIKNNNLVNMSKGLAMDNSNNPATSSYSTGVTSDYNNLYTKGTNLVNYEGTTYTSLSAWQTAKSFDANSISADPGYVSNTDLHVSSSAINNKGTVISSVTVDIDGETRNSSTPDIGADEFGPVKLDAGVTSLDSPAVYCAGKINFMVKISNFGTDDLKSTTVNWSIDGVTQKAYSWTGTLTIGNTSSQLLLGSVSLSANTPYVIKIWTSSPNGSTDLKNTNDTLRKTINTGLSGNYTIGGTSPNFKTFNDALDAITLRGLCGATVFNVRDGQYNEQLTIAAFPGASSTNTITFKSQNNDSMKVILAHGSSNANGTNNATIQLNGAKYIIFRDITITRTGTGTYMALVDIKGGASNNSFIENRFVGVKLSTASAEANSISSIGDKDTANAFRNNYFKYGNSAFSMLGSSKLHENSNVIDGNIIDSTFATPIVVSYNDGITINNNTLINTATGTSSTASYNGIALLECNGAIRITRNKLRVENGATAGIFLSSCVGTSTAPGLVANNYVSIATGSGNASPVGILLTGSSLQNVYFNSVNIYNTNTGAAFSTDAKGDVNLLNNIFANMGGGQTIIAGSSSLASSDYNLLYTTGSTFGTFGTSTTTSFAGWKFTSSGDAKSISVNPYFLSNTSFVTYNNALQGKGTALKAVNIDINGKTRNSSPNIGAFESFLKDDANISAVSAPKTGVCAGTEDVKVTLVNKGTATLTSATIDWSINGTAQKSYSWTGSISAGGNSTVTIASNTFTSGTYTIKAYVSAPNGNKDSFPYNDTISTSISVNALPTANAGTDISICDGEIIDIGSTAVKGETYSWTSDPVGFTSIDAMPSVNPSKTTVYTVEVTNGNGCKSKDDITVTVNPLPTPNAGANTQICEGESIQIGSTAVTGEKYSWTSDPAGFTSTDAMPTVNPMVTTTYMVEVTNANGCNASAKIEVVVNPLPKADAGADQSICTGGSIQIGSPTVTGMTYSWTGSNGFTSTDAQPTVSPTANSTYTLTVTGTGACTSTDEVTVTVNPLPTANAGNDVAICEGGSTQIGTTGTTGESYSWTAAGGYTSIDAMPTVNPTSTTTYTLEVKNASGCISKDEVIVTVNMLPTTTAGADKTICIGGTTQIGSTAVTGEIYSWTSASGFTSLDANPTITPAATETYTLTVTNASGCTSTDEVTVTVTPLPVANAGADKSICDGGMIQIGSTGKTGETYSWTSAGGFTSIDAMPTVNPAATTTYMLTVTSDGGCTSTDEVTITVNASPTDADFIAVHGTSLTYTFTANDVTLANYAWDFGDGNTGTGSTVSHTFTAAGTYNVKLMVANASGCSRANITALNVTVNGIKDASAANVSLNIYPNPFTSVTNLNYTLTQKANVTVQLTDVTGKQVAQIVQSVQAAGIYTYSVNANDYNLKSGIYFMNIQINGTSTTRKIVILN